MTISASIRAALEVALAAVPGIPAARAYQGVLFTPVLGTPWVRASIVWTTQRQAALGTDLYLHEGLFLVNVFSPQGKGAKAVEAIADAICADFVPTAPLGNGVRVRYAQKAALIEEPDWLSIPITIGFYTYATSP
jgi:hypothetical protein